MSQSQQKIRFCASADGTRIAYATCGSGPALIWVQHWIHHLELDWESPVWRPWLSLLTRHNTLIRYDWRGCGLSDRKRVQFSFAGFAEDLDAVIAASGVDRFVLFAMGGAGGAIAMRYAVRHPNRVTHLVLYGCNTRGALGDAPTAEQEAEAQARLKVYELGWPNENPGYGQFCALLHIPGCNGRAKPLVQRSAARNHLTGQHRRIAERVSAQQRAGRGARGPLSDAGVAFARRFHHSS